MFGSKATAALIKLKEIDRKYRIKRDDEKQHRSLSISELSSIEQQHDEILSQSQGIPASGDRPDSSARIKLNIQMPDTRMEPNDVTRSSSPYQPDARRREVFAILKKTEHSAGISKSPVEEHSEIPEDPAASDTIEMIVPREASESQTIDLDASIIESVAESLGQISSHLDEISQQRISARSRSSIPTEVVAPPTSAPSDRDSSYSEDFVDSGSSAAADNLETEEHSTSSRISPKSGTNQDTGVAASFVGPHKNGTNQDTGVGASSVKPHKNGTNQDTSVEASFVRPHKNGTNQDTGVGASFVRPHKSGTNQETGVGASFVRPHSPDQLNGQQPNSMRSNELEKTIASESPSPPLENVHSSRRTSQSQASSDHGSKLGSSSRRSGRTSSRNYSRVKDSLSHSEDGRNTIAATESDSQQKSERESSRRVSTSPRTGELAVAHPIERATRIVRAKTCNDEKPTVASKCEHPEVLATDWQDEIVRLVLGRLNAEVPATHVGRKTPSKRVSKSAKKRTRQNACLAGPSRSSANNDHHIHQESAIQARPTAAIVRLEGDPSTREKPKARAKATKSGCSSPQKRRSSKAKNEKTTCARSNRIQRTKSLPKRSKDPFRLRNENPDLERCRVRDQREQERLRSSVREHVRKLMEEQQRLSVWPEIPVTFARRDDFCDGASRERRCFRPLDLPNVVAFEKSELEDEVVEPTGRSLSAIRQRVLEIRHRLKDQFALYRDYSDLVSIVNARYKPVTLKDTKKIIRETRRSANNHRRRETIVFITNDNSDAIGHVRATKSATFFAPATSPVEKNC